MNELAWFDPKMPMAKYNADPCVEPSLRSSVAKTLLAECPAEAKAANETEKHSTKFDLGAAAHALVAGGDDSIAVIDAADWRTKAAKNERDEARAAGKTPLLTDQADRVYIMRHALREQMKARGDDCFVDGHPEVTFGWFENTCWNRARPDWMPELTPACGVVYDYKTTEASVNPFALQRFAFNQGWDIQAAMIRRGIKAAIGADVEVRFVVQRVTPPHRATVIGFSAFSMADADKEVTRAQELWGACLAAKDWPDYTALDVPLFDTPTYLVEQREARAELEGV